ncbi:MAG: sortase [Patescibacteria group bacterium]
MFPKGVIYQKGKSPKRGEVSFHPTFLTSVAYVLLRGLGGGLIAAAIVGLIFTYGPIVKEEASFLLFGPEEVSQVDFGQLVEADEAKKVQEEAKAWGVGTYFSLAIPKIGAKSDVTPNVDAANPKEYLEALKQGVAHAKGTHFPGQKETIFLFAHSTDSPINIAKYNAVFYLLRKLEVGDEIIVFFADKKYTYEVKEKVITSAKDTSWLKSTGKERLILQTCDPPGTTLKRLLVIAEPR